MAKNSFFKQVFYRTAAEQLRLRDEDVMDRDKLNSTQDKLSVSDFMRHVLDNDRRIYGYIYALIPNPSEAEDLFQDTVTIMWEKYESYLIRFENDTMHALEELDELVKSREL